MDNSKIFALIIGLAIIVGYSANFFLFRSPLDLLWISVGVVVFICGYYVENRKLKKTFSFYLAISCINIAQWVFLIYIYFFNQIYMGIDFYFFLVGVALITIVLIKQFYQSWFDPSDSGKKPISRVINNGIIGNVKQIFLVALGILISFGCLFLHLQTKSLSSLFFCSLGIMMVIYGYYLKTNKIQMSLNYFWMMLTVIIFQWILIFYMVVVITDVDELTVYAFITFIISSNFFMQIRGSARSNN